MLAGFRLPRLHEILGRLGKAKNESTRQSHLGEALLPGVVLSRYPCHTHSLAARSWWETSIGHTAAVDLSEQQVPLASYIRGSANLYTMAATRDKIKAPNF